MAKDKEPNVDPVTQSLLVAFNEIFGAMLTSAMYNGGPETAYIVANTAEEALRKQKESIKEVWIEQREKERQESSSSSP